MSVSWAVDRTLVDQQFADDVDAILGPSEYAWIVYYGLRTFAEQNALYQAFKAGTGGEAAPPGESAHEHGLAADVCEVVDGKRSWDESRPCWPWLWAQVLAAPRLHSGHSFPSDTNGRVAADDDHLESTRWPAVRAQLKSSGQWGTS